MMVGWGEFPLFGGAAALLWCLGATLATPVAWRRERLGTWLFLAGTILFALFIVLFWATLTRAPMRTMGETRLWYSLFIAATGWVLYIRWHYRFLLPFSAVLATVFALLNILKPEIQSTTLMPALQSAWFIPHVAIYMLAYALMAGAMAVGVASLRRGGEALMAKADRLMTIGSALLLLGMLMGAVWAQQAWGNYWAWDAKESWAAVTWLLALAYIHLRRRRPSAHRWAITLFAITFLALQITWYGVNYLPAAKKSLHTYTLNR